MKKNAPPPVGWRNLEVEAQAELHAARIVSAVQVKEACTRESAGRRLRRHAVVDAIELGMVEDIESFPPEFEPSPFVDRKTLESTEVKIKPSGEVERVPPDIAECESSGSRKGVRVVEQRSSLSRILIGAESTMGVANQIGTRTRRTGSIAYTCTVAETATIGHAEGQAGLSHCDARNLPSAKHRMSEATGTEDWQRINVADGEAMALVEIGAGPIAGDIVGIDERIVAAIRRIVNGVAIVVGNAESKIADRPVRPHLQGVVA